MIWVWFSVHDMSVICLVSMIVADVFRHQWSCIVSQYCRGLFRIHPSFVPMRYGLACVQNMAATPFRAEYKLRRSDWLKCWGDWSRSPEPWGLWTEPTASVAVAIVRFGRWRVCVCVCVCVPRCVCVCVCVCVCDIVLIAVCDTLINCLTSIWS